MKLFYSKIFQNQNRISVLFSESNREIVNRNGAVSGLNLGYNTNARREEVDQNFKFLFDEIGWDLNRLAIANQVHQTNIVTVTESGTYNDTDGFVSNQPGTILGIRVADCAAVLAGDPKNGVIGAFHAGWKGAAGNIIPKGIHKMIELGSSPDEIKVYISPCILQKNFEVGEEVAILFPDSFVDRVSYNKPHVDLQGFIIHQLKENGIKSNHIQAAELCTIEDKRFYSYRREREKAGRMLGLIKLNNL